MPSESARMSSTAEARFRVDTPNSKARAVTVIALDSLSDPIVRDLARREWNGAVFFTAADAESDPARVRDAISGADQVVMIAVPGQPAPAVASIGQACSLRRITTTGLVLCPAATTDEDLSLTLTQLRPWTLMLVIARSVEYIEDMLRALRA